MTKSSTPNLHQFSLSTPPVPAERHTNPDGSLGGWVAATAYAEPTVTIGENAKLFDYATARGTVILTDNAIAQGGARLLDSALLAQNAIAQDDTIVEGNAILTGNAVARGSTILTGVAWVGGSAETNGCVVIGGSASLGGQARVFDDAHIRSSNDTLWVDSIGSGQAVTFFRTENDTIAVSAGCIDFLSVAEMLNYARNTPEEWTEQEETLEKMVGWLAQIEALAQLAVVRFNLDPKVLQ